MITHIVPLDERSYPIYIGENTVHDLPKVINDLNPKQKNIIVITEHNVATLYADTIKAILENSEYSVDIFILPAGEETKSFENYIKVMNFCLEKNTDRNHILIAFGGGVIGDLVGFIASTLKRGCRFIQIPTTLLSQVDSSVGGKTAINSPHGKNLIGTFYQPSSVIIDINFIASLPQRVYLSGYAEVIKYGLLGDKDFFDYLVASHELMKKRDKQFLLKIISHSVKMKSDIVSRDETEQGERALLNLGHTFGHAYEAETGYSDILYHGEAVAIGMFEASRFSWKKGHLSEKEYLKIKEFLSLSGFSLDIQAYIPDYNPEAIIAHMMHDKKASNNEVKLILLKAIGAAFIEINKYHYILEYLNKN